MLRVIEDVAPEGSHYPCISDCNIQVGQVRLCRCKWDWETFIAILMHASYVCAHTLVLAIEQ